MSYDVTVYMDSGTGERLYAAESYNYTYNVYPMFARAGIGSLSRDHNGALCSEMLPILQKAVTAMENDPVGYKALNPSNGWGSYEGALEFLNHIKTLCARHPGARLEVS